MIVPVLFAAPAVLVARQWLASLPLFDGVDVGQGLKQPWSSWSTDYCIILSPIGGRADAYTPLRSQTIQVNLFGRPDSSQNRMTIPGNRLLSYAEYIIDQTIAFEPFHIVVPSASYYPVRLLDVAPGELPTRGPTSEAGLGRVTTEVVITYMAVYEET